RAGRHRSARWRTGGPRSAGRNGDGHDAHSGEEGPKAPKQAAQPKVAGSAREGSKTATVVSLLERTGGATLAEIMTATGWQAHSVRGFISGTLGKKMGRTVDSTKREDGERVYTIAK